MKAFWVKFVALLCRLFKCKKKNAHSDFVEGDDGGPGAPP